MSDEAITCTICHEALEPFHTVVRPRRCNHTFHAICINIWLTRHRSCPLCRRRISLATQMPWRTLFTTALIVTQEMALERAAYTYAFLSQVLKTYTTKAAWRQTRDGIIAAAEHFELGTIRLPYLDLTTRSTAKREKRKWSTLYQQVSGEEPRSSARVKSAKRSLLQYQFGGLQTFGMAHTIEQ
jgi:hypothetical protein